MEITMAEIRENCPPGWLPIVQLVWDILEEWRPIADLTGEPRPRIVRWTRDQYDPAGIVSYPWLEFDGFRSLDDFEFEKLERLSRATGRLVKTCEACGGGRSLRHFDPRAGGGVLYLCDACHQRHCADLSQPLPNNIGAPLQTIEPRERWATGRDDRAWYPGKDAEDDARDGHGENDDDLPF
jgi:hypothetical protein